MHSDPNIEVTPSRRDAPRASARAGLQATVWGLTDQGRVRSSNEDRFFVAPLSDAAPGASSAYLFAVADGVGGSRGGGVASTLAVETLEASLPTLRRLCGGRAARTGRVLEEIRVMFRSADARLAEEVGRKPELRGMATTLTLGVSLGRTLFVGHAGDSRCYVLRGGTMRRITVDQTLAVDLVRNGVVAAEDLEGHPFRHVLSNYLGIGGKLNVEVHEVDLAPGDTVLLCSDGLTGMVASPEIAGMLRAAQSPEAACRQLVARANELGGEDNVTAVVARFATPS